MKLIDIILVILVFITLFLVYKKRNINKKSEEMDIKEDFYATINSTIVDGHIRLIESIRNISTNALNILKNNDNFNIPAETINVKNLTIDGKILLNNDSVKLNLLPKNMVIAFAGNNYNIPIGWALCDGKIYSLDDNGNVVEDIIGTKTPDLRGRFILGAGIGIDKNSNNLKERKWKDKEGEENHTLTIQEMPAHDHSLIIYLPTYNIRYNWYKDLYTPKQNILTVTIGIGHISTRENPPYSYRDDLSVDLYPIFNKFNINSSQKKVKYNGVDILPVEIKPAGGILIEDTGYIRDGANDNYGPPQYTTKPHNNMPPFYVLTYIMKI